MTNAQEKPTQVLMQEVLVGVKLSKIHVHAFQVGVSTVFIGTGLVFIYTSITIIF